MDIQLPQIIFQIINFSVVFIGVSFLLSKPIKKILSERMDKIAEGQKAATLAIEENEKLEITKKQAKKDSDKEVAAIISTAQVKANKQGKEIIADARAQAQKDVEKLKLDWEKEKQSMLKQAHSDMVSAIMDVSEKVISEKLTSKTDANLIDKELDAMIAGI